MSASDQATRNIFRFTDTDGATGANQSMGRLQWFSSDSSGGGACVKAEIESLASDTTPDAYMVFKTHEGSGTTPTERLRITSAGSVTIGGETSPDWKFTVYDAGYTGVTIKTNRNTSTDNIGGLHFKTQTTNVAYIQSLVDGTIKFRNSSSLDERLRITSAGKLFLHGTGATGANNITTRLPNGYTFNIHGNSSEDGISIVRYNTSYGAYGINIGRSRSNTIGTNTAVLNGNELGHISFYGADGTDFEPAAQITALCDGEVASSSDATDMPGALSFRTTPNGSNTPTQRMKINQVGDVHIDVNGSGGTSSQQGVLRFYRTGYSGDMLDSRIVFDTSNGSNNTNNATYCSVIAGKRTDSNNGASDLRFYTCSDANSYAVTERLRITETGAVTISGNNSAIAPTTYNDLTGTNQAGLLIGSSSITDAGIMLRTGSTGTGRIYFGDNSGSDAGRKQGRIEYYNNGDYMLLGANGVGESIRITGGAAEQATLVINSTQTNGNTWIGDNYTASATEHTCTIGNMYSGGGFFAGYAMKPKSDSWGFVSSTDAYADRRACLTLGGSGYDAFRVDATNSSQTITTGADVTTNKVLAVEHSGNVVMNQNGGYLKARIEHGAGNDGTVARGRLKQWYSSDLDPSIGSSSSGWYPIMDISDGQYLFMIGTSAHNSATCLVCNGYDPSAVSRINVLQCVRNNNGNYLNIQEIRVLNNGVVEVYLYAGNPQYFQMWVQVLSDREMPTFYTTLTKNTGSPTIDDSKNFWSYSSSVGAGLMHVENLRVDGTISKGTDNFEIPHPLPSKKDTHHLFHSMIEGPQCDNIYRGKVTLSSGAATVNLDTVSNMTEGTFVLLNRDVQCFTTNETGWGAVKGSVSGNILTISAQDGSSTDTISWMVVGERQDDAVKKSNSTDSDGHLVVERDVSLRDDLTDSTPPS